MIGAISRLPKPVAAALAMIGACAAFAVMMVLVRFSTETLHPLQTVFFRNLFGLAFMLPWLVRVGPAALRTKRPWAHLARATCGLVAMMCLFTAVGGLPLAEVTAITFAAPLFATVGAALILRETVRLRRWTATVIGFAGVLIILRPGAEALHPLALVALGAAAFMAVAMLFIKSLSRTEHPNAIVVTFGLLMTPLSLIPALFVWQTPTASEWAILVCIGAAATVGQVLLTRAFRSADASAVAPFDFSRLVFVSILASVFFGETSDLWTWVGAAVIVSATVYIAHREAVAGRRKRAAVADYS